MKLENEPVRDADDFWQKLEAMADASPGLDLNKLLKRFMQAEGDLTGVCIKSLPFDQTLAANMQFISDCTDADGNLIHLPFPGTVMKQPAAFIEFLDIVAIERSRLARTRTKPDEEGQEKPPGGTPRKNIPRPRRRKPTLQVGRLGRRRA